MEKDIKVGSRIISDSYVGTVKFIGAVENAKGTWLGVEWDDSSRGLHDGCKDGVRYFQTNHPKAGSFIRRQKATIGRDFLEVVKDRYGKIDDDNAGVITEELYIKGKGQRTVVEMVGAEKVNTAQGDLRSLVEIVLRGEDVYGVKNGDDLTTCLPNVRQLDVSKSLVSSLQSVAGICVQLPKLIELHVSENKLKLPPDGTLAASFQNVKTLFANRLAFDWQQIVSLVSHFESLQTLHVCFNAVQLLSDVTTRLRHIRLLNLESNSIDDWGQVMLLAGLPDLETLILNDNRISSIHFETSDQFKALKSLSLNRNAISEWSSVNELDRLENLVELKLAKNPVTSPTPKVSLATIRTILIARLGRLRILDRVVIDKVERLGSEYDYIKSAGKLWRDAGGDADPAKSRLSHDFRQQHPRYQALVEKYGPPLEEEMEEQTSALKKTLIGIYIRCAHVKKVPQLKKLPVTMTVQKLKALAQRMFGGNGLNLRLTYTSEKMKGPEIELDNDLRDLYFYGIAEGDTVTVEWD